MSPSHALKFVRRVSHFFSPASRNRKLLRLTRTVNALQS
jgi:hypothetical protein